MDLMIEIHINSGVMYVIALVLLTWAATRLYTRLGGKGAKWRL